MGKTSKSVTPNQLLITGLAPGGYFVAGDCSKEKNTPLTSARMTDSDGPLHRGELELSVFKPLISIVINYKFMSKTDIVAMSSVSPNFDAGSSPVSNFTNSLTHYFTNSPTSLIPYKTSLSEPDFEK